MGERKDVTDGISLPWRRAHIAFDHHGVRKYRIIVLYGVVFRVATGAGVAGRPDGQRGPSRRPPLGFRAGGRPPMMGAAVQTAAFSKMDILGVVG